MAAAHSAPALPPCWRQHWLAAAALHGRLLLTAPSAIVLLWCRLRVQQPAAQAVTYLMRSSSWLHREC